MKFHKIFINNAFPHISWGMPQLICGNALFDADIIKITKTEIDEN
jgi:hypothetical protein